MYPYVNGQGSHHPVCSFPSLSSQVTYTCIFLCPKFTLVQLSMSTIICPPVTFVQLSKSTFICPQITLAYLSKSTFLCPLVIFVQLSMSTSMMTLQLSMSTASSLTFLMVVSITTGNRHFKSSQYYPLSNVPILSSDILLLLPHTLSWNSLCKLRASRIQTME